MSFAGTTFKVTGLLAVVCLVLAAGTLWVALTDPVTVAMAVDTRDLAPILGLLTHAFASAFRAFIRYL